uniref:Uncharacterized protein n=1 Tax=Arundo donax TaxID=35708 RepID=A0A0A8XYR8_ARUDO
MYMWQESEWLNDKPRGTMHKVNPVITWLFWCILIVHIFQHTVPQTSLVTCGLVNFHLSFCVISLYKLVYVVYMESKYLIADS